MKPEAIESAIRASVTLLDRRLKCGDMVAKTVMFVERARKNSVTVQRSVDLHTFLDFSSSAYTPEKFPDDDLVQAGDKTAICRHVCHLLQEMGSIPSVDKQRSRRIGFANGALDYTRLAVLWESASSPNDVEALVSLAHSRDATDNSLAHAALGNLQGFLWPAAPLSIRQLRAMNKGKLAPFLLAA